jgi:hypothetical protein
MTATRIDLTSTSRSGDAGYLAARDLVTIATQLGLEYRLVGGVGVALLTSVHGVADRVPGRETADADFGVDTATIGDARLTQALLDHGYVQVAGNRFTRDLRRDRQNLPLAVDLLMPSHSGRLETNVLVGDLSVDAVPALGLALAMRPTTVRARLTLTDGELLELPLSLPDVSAALCLKALAYGGRRSARDAVDVWRLLEAAHAAGVRAERWNPARTGARLDTSRIVHREFANPAGPGVRAATRDKAAQARIRALALEVVARPPIDDAAGITRG